MQYACTLMKRNITVGLVTYNSAEVISGALFPLCKKLPIILCDNKSNDTSIKSARKACPHIKILRNKENSGFAKACNTILKTAQSKYVLIINPDIRIDPSAIMHLYDVAEKNINALLIAPVLKYTDGRVQKSFIPFFKNKPALFAYSWHDNKMPFSSIHRPLNMLKMFICLFFSNSGKSGYIFC